MERMKRIAALTLCAALVWMPVCPAHAEGDAPAPETETVQAPESAAAPVEEQIVAPVEEPPAAPAEEAPAAPDEEPPAAPTEEPPAAPAEEPPAAPAEEPSAAPAEEPPVAPAEVPPVTTVEVPPVAPVEEAPTAPVEEPTPEPTEEPTPTPEPTPYMAKGEAWTILNGEVLDGKLQDILNRLAPSMPKVTVYLTRMDPIRVTGIPLALLDSVLFAPDRQQIGPGSRYEVTVTLENDDPATPPMVFQIMRVEKENPDEPDAEPTNPPAGEAKPTDPPAVSTGVLSVPLTSNANSAENTAEPIEPPVNEAEPTEPPVNDTEPTEPPVNEAEPTKPPVNEAEPTEPPVNDTEPTEPPVNDAEPIEPPVNEAEPTEPPAIDTGMPDVPPVVDVVVPTETPAGTPEPEAALPTEAPAPTEAPEAPVQPEAPDLSGGFLVFADEGGLVDAGTADVAAQGDIDDMLPPESEVTSLPFITAAPTPDPNATPTPEPTPTPTPSPTPAPLFDLTVDASGVTTDAWQTVAPTFGLGGIAPEQAEEYVYGLFIDDERLVIFDKGVTECVPEMQGEHTYRFCVLNTLGDVFKLSPTYKLMYDSVPPKITVAATDIPDGKKTKRVVSFELEDEESGIAEWSMDGGLTWELYEEGQQFLIYPIKDGQLIDAGYLRVRDAAGNETVSEEYIVPKQKAQAGGGSGDGKKAIVHVPETADYSLANYNALELDFPDEASTTLVAGDSVLPVSLTETVEGERQTGRFTAELASWRETDKDMARLNALVLTAAEEDSEVNTWSFSGDAYRLLYNSGVDYLVFATGDYIAAVPTAGFTGGTAYAKLKAGGVSTRRFSYTVNQDEALRETTLSVEVEGETYLLGEAKDQPMYRYDVLIGTRDMMLAPYRSYLPEEDSAQDTVGLLPGEDDTQDGGLNG